MLTDAPFVGVTDPTNAEPAVGGTPPVAVELAAWVVPAVTVGAVPQIPAYLLPP